MPRIAHRDTGEVFTIDPREARVKRMRRRVWAWCKAVEDYRNSCKEKLSSKMITLTYAKQDGWKPLHIREFMLQARKFLAGRLKAYAWVAEMQKRGAVHYHVLLVFTKGRGLPHADKAGWWKHGMTRVEEVRVMLYLMKYTQKGITDENHYPVGARIFAVWLPREVQISKERARNWLVSPYPKWLVAHMDDCNWSNRPRPAKGGGWLVGDKVIKSPYIFLGR